MKHLRFVAAVLLVAGILASPKAAGPVQALGRVPAIDQSAQVPVTLKLTVVISRFENDKKVGSLPFVLMIVPNMSTDGRDGESTSLQMGADYPVPTTSTTEGKTVISYQYRSLGTNIIAAGRFVDEGRFAVMVNVQDSQVMSDAAGGSPKADSILRFQNFRSQNRLILRDAQTVQYTAATDKTSGEVVKVDVTMNVIR